MGFGESSLDFEIRAWTDRSDSFVSTHSEVALAAHDVLVEANVEIPYPQRDLHVRSPGDQVRRMLQGSKLLPAGGSAAPPREHSVTLGLPRRRAQ